MSAPLSFGQLSAELGWPEPDEVFLVEALVWFHGPIEFATLCDKLDGAVGEATRRHAFSRALYSGRVLMSAERVVSLPTGEYRLQSPRDLTAEARRVLGNGRTWQTVHLDVVLNTLRGLAETVAGMSDAQRISGDHLDSRVVGARPDGLEPPPHAVPTSAAQTIPLEPIYESPLELVEIITHLRAAIDAAPHAPFCQINAAKIITGERVTGQCDCWKSRALGGAA